jgi:serine kinase of HPr protein (carbohydrate metabolism regulator)
MTIHATAVVIGETGVLIRGASGSGKTALAFALIEAARRDGLFAAFVSDDRVALESAGGRLIARVPQAIAGRAERRGRGIEAVSFVPAAVIRLIVDIEPDERLERMPEEASRHVEIEGIRLARLAVPSRANAVSVPLVLAEWREMNKF